jgi:hypothetical protein
MPAAEHQAPSERAPTPITLDELIRGGLAGKLVALARYDEIIWKIRAGYVAVLYGMLAFFVGKESNLVEFMSSSEVLRSLFPISLSLSLCAFVVDLAFVLSKLRVVAARNHLSDLAVKRAAGHKLHESEQDEFTKLLHLSGEALTLPPLELLIAGLWPLLPLYLVTPIAIRLVVP